jgi:hypothetical protein
MIVSLHHSDAQPPPRSTSHPENLSNSRRAGSAGRWVPLAPPVRSKWRSPPTAAHHQLSQPVAVCQAPACPPRGTAILAVSRSMWHQLRPNLRERAPSSAPPPVITEDHMQEHPVEVPPSGGLASAPRAQLSARPSAPDGWILGRLPSNIEKTPKSPEQPSGCLPRSHSATVPNTPINRPESPSARNFLPRQKLQPA